MGQILLRLYLRVVCGLGQEIRIMRLGGGGGGRRAEGGAVERGGRLEGRERARDGRGRSLRGAAQSAGAAGGAGGAGAR